MALQQYNQFDPKLAGLEGNMQAEPRVFAHDAVPVVIGAINASDANKGLTITASGNGFIVGEVITYAAGSPAGAGSAGAGSVAAGSAAECETSHHA